MQVWDVSRKEPLIALPNCMLIALPHCMQVWDVSRKEPLIALPHCMQVWDVSRKEPKQLLSLIAC